jgi:uncharacterized protein
VYGAEVELDRHKLNTPNQLTPTNCWLLLCRRSSSPALAAARLLDPVKAEATKPAALAVETTRVSEQEAGKGQDLPGLPHRLRCVLLTTEDFSMSAPTDVRTYPAGVPCWIDSEQRDLQAACAFYGELFGWVFSDAASPERAGTYYVAAVDGRDVAALGSSTGAPVVWQTYIAVDDVEAATARVTGHGGRLLGEPAEVGSAGSLAVCVDREGGEVLRLAGVRPVRRAGRERAGHMELLALLTRDLDRARAFYEAVFPWTYSEVPGAAGMWRVAGYGDHLQATVDPEIYLRQANAPEGFADVVAGAEMIADEETPRWKVVFSVADRDQTAATAVRLGAEVIESRDTMWTREADLRDPQEAELTISQFAPPDSF